MIELINVTKQYKGSHQIILDHVTATLCAESGVGILGQNGTGKSTLLRLIAGAERANSGEIIRHGRVSWPLGFSGGLHYRMTGTENARFVARIYGEDENRIIRDTEDFAELGPDMNKLVGLYSSGMRARLAFGLSLAIDFDVFLIDEIISVGDARFRARCEDAVNDRAQRALIILVSHDPAMVARFCDRTARLESGHLIWQPTGTVS
jgi:capsular polysaccharide transport system ATP-binding protein